MGIYYVFWKCHLNKFTLSNLSIKEIVNIILTNQEQSIYYFMFKILGVYLAIPIFTHLTDQKYRKTLWYAIIAYFIFDATLPTLSSIFGIKYNAELTVKFGYGIFYAFLGYLVSKIELKKNQRYLIYGLGFFSAVFRYTFTLMKSTSANKIIKTLFGYGQFHSILLALAVFVFIKYLDYSKINEKISRKITKIASCSFGIYLIHMIVMHYEIKFLHIVTMSWQWRTLGIFLTYGISLGIVMLLKQIPIVKKIVP